MISYKFITKDEFLPLFRKYRSEIFQDNNDIDINAIYTESEKEKTAELDKMCTTQYQLYLTAWDGEKLIGWSWGFQKSELEFFHVQQCSFSRFS